MANEKIYSMPFAKLYPMLIAKAEKKGAPEKKLMKSPAG